MKSIYNFLEEYGKSHIYPFHMPGHKGNLAFFPAGLHQMDITEIPGSDNLHHPTGPIRQLEKKLSDIYSASRSFFLVNGSTGGIIGAILACCPEGEGIIAARNAHRSFYAGVVLSGAKPYYIQPGLGYMDNGICGGISPEGVETAILAHPDASAVYMTSPTYEGVVSDVQSIACICKKYGKKLIVDEAHGSHFPFSDEFPLNAMVLGADLVIHSLHKTLPVMGQGAVLHIGPGVDETRVSKVLAMTQTSSPSYAIMGQTDFALDKLLKDKNIFKEYIGHMNRTREVTRFLQGLRLLGGEQKGRDYVYDIDRSKLVYVVAPPLTGHELEKILREDWSIQIEAGGLQHIIVLSSCADTHIGFDRLTEALHHIASSREFQDLKKDLYDCYTPRSLMTPREAAFHRSVKAPIEEGRISSGFVTPYPPGVPILVPGELVDKAVMERIKAAECSQNQRMLGILEGLIDVVDI